jgi:hypothetical protein
MSHTFAFDDCVTTHEPVIPNLLCSESIPRPGVVEAAAVVVVSEGSTMFEEVSSGDAGTIDPCPGNACVTAIGCSLEGVVVAVDDAELDAVSAAATPLEMATRKNVRTAIVMRRAFIILKSI